MSEFKKALNTFAKHLAGGTPSKPKEDFTYVHKFEQAVCTEYYVMDGASQTGCMGTKLKKNYSVASHNMPCGTKLYIPALKGIVNKDGLFEVEDTGGMSFDFDIFTGGNSIGKVGKRNCDVYVLEWGNKKMTTSYTYIINYFKNKRIFERYRKSWELYLKMGGKVIDFWKFNDEDKKLNKKKV